MDVPIFGEALIVDTKALIVDRNPLLVDTKALIDDRNPLIVDTNPLIAKEILS